MRGIKNDRGEEQRKRQSAMSQTRREREYNAIEGMQMHQKTANICGFQYKFKNVCDQYHEMNRRFECQSLVIACLHDRQRQGAPNHFWGSRGCHLRSPSGLVYPHGDERHGEH
jgi:hypothetical protein